MVRSKYKFNPESLEYTKVEKNLKQKLLHTFAYIATFLIFMGGGYLLFSFVIDSPKEKGLKRQISEMNLTLELFNRHLDNLEVVLGEMQERDDNIYRTIFEAEPLNYSVREAGFGGSNLYRELESLENSEIVIETAKRLDILLRKTSIQSDSYDDLVEMALSKEKMLAAIPAIQPISNKDLTRTASGWGYRIHPIYKIVKFHYGIDFTAPTGTEIYATGDATVEQVETSNRGYGNCITLNHSYGYLTIYAHLDGFNVRKGQKVKRGDVIGYVGNTGLSTAPHLHYEVIRNQKKVNPINYFFNDLSAEEYDRMIELSMRPGQSFD
ncbi:MAG: M23 family metallopeptidase [Bacteroidales bacterium]|nr:M23 family metallopeptidase [Bacteroidales bacterium]